MNHLLTIVFNDAGLSKHMEGLTNDIEKSHEMVFSFLKTVIYLKRNITLFTRKGCLKCFGLVSGINTGREDRRQRCRDPKTKARTATEGGHGR